MSETQVTPAWNFNGMLMENNSRVITDADATLVQEIYDYGTANPKKSTVTVEKDDDKAHFFFNLCSEKGEPAYIKIEKDTDGNVVITGSDHTGVTSEKILASKIELTENENGVLISLLTTEDGELTRQDVQIYDSKISVEETSYGALVTITNSKGTSSEAKLYSPSITAARSDDNSGVTITIIHGKEGATPTVVQLYEPTIEGKRITGGAEITINNHTGEDPTVINLYDAGSTSLAEEYSNNKTYSVGDYVSYESDFYICIKQVDIAEEWDATKWKSTKISNELTDKTHLIADSFDETKDYKEEKYVIYDNKLYKSNQEVLAGEFNSSQWAETKVTDELSSKNYMVTMGEYKSLTPVKNGLYFITTPSILGNVMLFECGDTADSIVYKNMTSFISYVGSDFQNPGYLTQVKDGGYGVALYKSWSGYGSMIVGTSTVPLNERHTLKVKFYLATDGAGKSTLYMTTKKPATTFTTSEWTELGSSSATSASSSDIIEAEYVIPENTTDNIYFCLSHTESSANTALSLIKSIEAF